ncbi:MAG: hypothetical protein PHE17_16420 [Thiothrix sp.]|uniref:hypothetical protein n=1 Tax=Thiothrix sp. TaxID=1032 RepID=UPI00261C5837|nr:hypothetical protein [Thiothrix sp.]MDD5394601.1 hypothetical protein [Thiothrix sp.]
MAEQLLAIPTKEGLEAIRLAGLARLATGRKTAAKASKAELRAMRRTKAGRLALVGAKKAAANTERPSAQLNLFVTDVRLPKSAREQYVSMHGYGPEWAGKHLAMRLNRLGEVLQQDGFRSSRKLRLCNVPGICFAMRVRDGDSKP